MVHQDIDSNEQQQTSDQKRWNLSPEHFAAPRLLV